MPLPPGAVILQVVPRLESGGVERGTVEMVQAIAEAGGTPVVASEGGALVAAVTAAGGRHVTLKLGSKSPLRIWLQRRPPGSADPGGAGPDRARPLPRPGLVGAAGVSADRRALPDHLSRAL